MTALANGRFLVTFERLDYSSTPTISSENGLLYTNAVIYNADGSVYSSEQTLLTRSDAQQLNNNNAQVSVVALPNGGFAMAYLSADQATSTATDMVAIYDANGVLQQTIAIPATTSSTNFASFRNSSSRPMASSRSTTPSPAAASTTLVTPTISAPPAGHVLPTPTPLTPFAGVVVADAAPVATETLSIQQTGGGVLADGVGFSGLTLVKKGLYSLSGTPTAVTAELDALTFAPVASSTATFTLTDTTGAGTSTKEKIAYSFNASAALTKIETWNADGSIHDIDYLTGGTFHGVAYASYDNSYAFGFRNLETFYDASGNVVASETFQANGGYSLYLGGTLEQQKTVNADGTYDIHTYGVTGQAYTDYDIVYNASGKPTYATYSNGMSATYSYDASGNLSEIVTTGIRARTGHHLCVLWRERQGGERDFHQERRLRSDGMSNLDGSVQDIHVRRERSPASPMRPTTIPIPPASATWRPSTTQAMYSLRDVPAERRLLALSRRDGVCDHSGAAEDGQCGRELRHRLHQPDG